MSYVCGIAVGKIRWQKNGAFHTYSLNHEQNTLAYKEIHCLVNTLSFMIALFQCFSSELILVKGKSLFSGSDLSFLLHLSHILGIMSATVKHSKDKAGDHDWL